MVEYKKNPAPQKYACGIYETVFYTTRLRSALRQAQWDYVGFKGFKFTKVGRVLKKKYPTTLSKLIDSYDGFKVF